METQRRGEYYASRHTVFLFVPGPFCGASKPSEIFGRWSICELLWVVVCVIVKTRNGRPHQDRKQGECILATRTVMCHPHANIQRPRRKPKRPSDAAEGDVKVAAAKVAQKPKPKAVNKKAKSKAQDKPKAAPKPNVEYHSSSEDEGEAKDDTAATTAAVDAGADADSTGSPDEAGPSKTKRNRRKPKGKKGKVFLEDKVSPLSFW